MYQLPTANYQSRNLQANRLRSWQAVPVNSETHQQRVLQELKQLGVSKYGLLTLESRHLPNIIHPEEHLLGVVYGHHETGHVMLVATNLRVIFLDKKFLFTNQDDIDYFVVSGVTYGRAGFGSTVTLHTRIKDFAIRTYNNKCAQGFVTHIQQRIERMQRGYSWDGQN